MATKLIISEMFYSLQGEGASVGRPAVFLRLAACNLECPGFSYQDPTTQQHLGCDTKLIWKKGYPTLINDILKQWQQQGWLTHIKNGAHLVITGGEPLLQQDKSVEFIKALDDYLGFYVYIEIETNATLMPNAFLLQRINQFNVSPKLRSSGETEAKAYKVDVLNQFSKLAQAYFKFVIHDANDVQEIQERYQQVFNIPAARIWLMPEGGSRHIMEQRLALVANLCIENNYNFSPRLHIHIWDVATGK